MEKTSSVGWKVMGIVSLVIGSLSIILAFVPCVGGLAIYSGIVATILSIIAFIMANNARASKSIAVIALIVSVASIGVGYWRAKQLEDALGSGADKISHTLDSIKNAK